ncbi:hypothetical protein RJ639_026902 [Escallonia herrerae]|uniref:Uncharacterized protein n=1 Tax=Escallonia herrerae TaxID=1293975 RepID=A0AA88XLX4_9ASTE|nr:hypothetical protein RJ639_026902 [Escallonia herrerae]
MCILDPTNPKEQEAKSIPCLPEHFHVDFRIQNRLSDYRWSTALILRIQSAGIVDMDQNQIKSWTFTLMLHNLMMTVDEEEVHKMILKKRSSSLHQLIQRRVCVPKAYRKRSGNNHDLVSKRNAADAILEEQRTGRKESGLQLAFLVKLEILIFLQQYDYPASLDLDQMAYVDKWHALIKHNCPSACISLATYETACGLMRFRMSCCYFLNCSGLGTSQIQDFCSFYDSWSACTGKVQEQRQLSTPMVWIGFYVAAASLVCSLAMAADAFLGFRNRKLWFPCRFFTLNATSLTLLAVATKLPLDLSTSMPSKTDQLAKLCSAVFMCTMMGSFMPSLGTMDNKDLLVNVTALGILVVTVVVNVTIQLYTGAISEPVYIEYPVVMALMFILLVTIIFSALTVPVCNGILELKYIEMHKIASNEEEPEQNGKSNVDKLKADVVKYWTMAETGSSQFLMANSATCAASGAICLIATLTLVEVETRAYLWGERHPMGNPEYPFSDYQYATVFILAIQSIGVLVGTIAPAVRWFTASTFEFSKKGNNIYRENFKVETYWVQRLVDWKESPLAFKTGGLKCRKFLQGEEELPRGILIDISNNANRLIQRSKEQQLKKLMDLLRKSSCFTGVAEFDSNQILSLHSEEPHSCWSQSLVTLTSIAVALPNIDNNAVNQLLCSVSEDLFYVNIIEKSLDTCGDLGKIRNAVDVVWVEVELYHQWLGKDVRKMSLEGKSSKETLQQLADIAKNSVMEYRKELNCSLEENPLHWPVKVIAVNSMYRISETLLLNYQGSDSKTGEKLFEQLSVVIADILDVCLTKPHVISMKCYCGAIKKREKSIRLAARLLGQTEDILKMLQQCQLPSLDSDRVVHIGESSASTKQMNPFDSYQMAHIGETHFNHADESLGS